MGTSGRKYYGGGRIFYFRVGHGPGIRGFFRQQQGNLGAPKGAKGQVKEAAITARGGRLRVRAQPGEGRAGGAFFFISKACIARGPAPGQGPRRFTQIRCGAEQKEKGQEKTGFFFNIYVRGGGQVGGNKTKTKKKKRGNLRGKRWVHRKFFRSIILFFFICFREIFRNQE